MCLGETLLLLPSIKVLSIATRSPVLWGLNQERLHVRLADCSWARHISSELVTLLIAATEQNRRKARVTLAYNSRAHLS